MKMIALRRDNIGVAGVGQITPVSRFNLRDFT
jgi:hypothetical protein